MTQHGPDETPTGRPASRPQSERALRLAASVLTCAAVFTAVDVVHALRLLGVRWISPIEWWTHAAWAFGVYCLVGVVGSAAGWAAWGLLRRARLAGPRLERVLTGPAVVFGLVALLWTIAAAEASFLSDVRRSAVCRSASVWVPSLAGSAALAACVLAKLARWACRRPGPRRWARRVAWGLLALALVVVLAAAVVEFGLQPGFVRVSAEVYGAHLRTSAKALMEHRWAVAAVWLLCFLGCGLAAGFLAHAAYVWTSPRVRRWAAIVSAAIVLALGLGLLALGPRPGRRAAHGRAGQGNVVLVTVDALRADYLSCYGSRAATPHIDAVAAKGVRFSKAITACPWTRPACASLMLSTCPTAHGIGEKGSESKDRAANCMPPELTVLAEAFQRAGYATQAFVSNTQLHRQFLFDRGFDDYCMYEDVGARMTWLPLDEAVAPRLSIVRRARRLGRLEFLDRQAYPDEDVRHLRGAMLASSDAFLVARAVQWLRQARRPFFLWVHLMGVHEYGSYRMHMANRPDATDPMDRLMQLARGTRITGSVEADPFDASRVAGRLLWWPAPWTLRAPIPDGLDMGHYAERYRDNVAYVDAALGCLFAEIDAHGLADSTHLVLTSDHGEEFGEHRGAWHGHTQYEEVIRVPLIIRSPKLQPGGRAVEQPCSLIDVAPTLLDLAAVPLPSSFDGQSVLPLASGQEDTPRVVHAEFVSSPANERKARREGDMKCITPGAGRGAELYDLAEDPGEQDNLAEDNAYLLREMLKRLYEWERAQAKLAKGLRGGREGRITISEEMSEMLKGLGY